MIGKKKRWYEYPWAHELTLDETGPFCSGQLEYIDDLSDPSVKITVDHRGNSLVIIVRKQEKNFPVYSVDGKNILDSYDALWSISANGKVHLSARQVIHLKWLIYLANKVLYFTQNT